MRFRYRIPYGYYDPHFMGGHPPAGYGYPPTDLPRYMGEWNSEMYPRYGPMPYPPGYVHHMHPQMQWYHSEFGATPMEQHFAGMSARYGYQPQTMKSSQADLKKSQLSVETAPKTGIPKRQGPFVKPPNNMRGPKVVEVSKSRQVSKTKSPSIDRRITATERLSSSRNTSARQSASKLPRAETPTRMATKGSLLTNPKLQSAVDVKPKQTAASMMTSVTAGPKASETPKKKGLSSWVSRLDNMRKKAAEGVGPILSSIHQSSSSLTKPVITTSNPARLQPVASPTKRLELTGPRLQGSSREAAPGPQSILSNVLGRTPKYLGQKQGSAPRTDLYAGPRGLQSTSRGGSRSGTPQKLVVRPK